jgi:hypothetical protein
LDKFPPKNNRYKLAWVIWIKILDLRCLKPN